MSTRRIAALLGISAATVSLALNHHPRIPEATRRRVKAAARKFGYRTNASRWSKASGSKASRSGSTTRDSKVTPAQLTFTKIVFARDVRGWITPLRGT